MILKNQKYIINKLKINLGGVDIDKQYQDMIQEIINNPNFDSITIFNKNLEDHESERKS